MGTCRESRPSEAVFKSVVHEFMSLNNCVWYGKHLLEGAKEHVDFIKSRLDEVIELMEKENA